MRIRALSPLLLSLALVAACGGDDSTTTTVAAPTSADVLAAGPHGVGVTTVIFTDSSRPTMANGSRPASDSRRLVTEIWYPAAAKPDAPAAGQRDAALDASGGPYPLVLYSHGFSDLRTGCSYLARHLASHGYIVAAPDFPLTNFNTVGGPNGADLVNQPGDLSFLIDRLLAGEPDDRFAASIDAGRIGLAGLSLGGTTTSLATYHPDLRDPRVRAAATLAGGSCFFGEKFYAHSDVPLLLVHGDLDAIVPYEGNSLHAYGVAHAPKTLLTVHGGTHTAFTEVASVILDQVDNADEPACTALGGGRPPGEDDGDGGFPDLGGEDAGIIAGDCPAACRGPYPRAIRPPRQRQLAILGVFPFFEAYLRGRTEMREFLEKVAASENEEISVQFQD